MRISLTIKGWILHLDSTALGMLRGKLGKPNNLTSKLTIQMH